MGKLRVAAIGVSLDGFAAGPNQSLNTPLGERGMELMEWFMGTKTFLSMQGKDGGSTGVDNDFAVKGFENMGAWILGRNMFGPVRGPWPDDKWKGWWGDNPPYHVPTFVLTHHARAPITMEGGTTFTFVTEGIQRALELAKKAAGNKDIRVGGGTSTIRQYLQAGLVDEIHLAVRPILMGSGELLFAGLDLPKLGYRCKSYTPTEKAAHVIFEKGVNGPQ